ncbi:MAG: phosphoribosylformylglycinamidine cyclo-ligase [Candidatus Schekmanbacteria bacterium]|nr:MAG: phosphoribosylformylglycinamidine cyclo-ligase [Candidatus Schekmanbacteria bacterium]
MDYKSSGVDISSGNLFIEKIKPLARSTFTEGVVSDLGGFGGFFRIPQGLKKPCLVSATDGVGTKLKIAFEAGKHSTVGIDLVAMCANDIIVCGATPLFFLDYFATGKLSLDEGIEVVKGIAEGCRQAEMALIGGETAEMPGFYKEGEYDLAGFAVGIVDEANILPSGNIKENDVIIGLASSGLHSNGFSLVRKLFFDELGLSVKDEFPTEKGKTVGDVLLEPTKIYVKTVKPLLNAYPVKAIAHITGGGLIENIPRILQKNLSAEINSDSWELPNIFRFIMAQDMIEREELYRTFNMGIGLVLIVDEKESDNILTHCISSGQKGWKIGRIVRGNHKVIIN